MMLEKDIQDFQEQLKRDDDDYYFRQLDAEKVVQQLNMTRYQTGLWVSRYEWQLQILT